LRSMACRFVCKTTCRAFLASGYPRHLEVDWAGDVCLEIGGYNPILVGHRAATL
jgi:hypothetical protein